MASCHGGVEIKYIKIATIQYSCLGYKTVAKKIVLFSETHSNTCLTCLHVGMCGWLGGWSQLMRYSQTRPLLESLGRGRGLCMAVSLWIPATGDLSANKQAFSLTHV